MIIGKKENLKKKINQGFKKINKEKKIYKIKNEQKKAFEYLDLINNKFDVSVLQGTTGSGKTLVYFERIKKIINNKITFFI